MENGPITVEVVDVEEVLPYREGVEEGTGRDALH